MNMYQLVHRLEEMNLLSAVVTVKYLSLKCHVYQCNHLEREMADWQETMTRGGLIGSNFKSGLSGVPKDCVLWAILFWMNINDFEKCVNSKMQIFSDDTDILETLNARVVLRLVWPSILLQSAGDRVATAAESVTA